MLSAQYLHHVVPDLMSPQLPTRLRVKVLNTGDEAWPCSEVEPHRVYLAAWVNGLPAAAGYFAHADIAPGQSAEASIELTPPNELGSFILKIGLVQQDIAYFEDHGVDPLVFEPRIASRRLFEGNGAATLVPRYRFDVVNVRLPPSVAPGILFGLRLKLRNTGAMTWESADHRKRLVSATLTIDGLQVAGSVLPSSVPPGGIIDFQLTVSAPDRPGRHQALVGLVHESVTAFSAQVPAAAIEINVRSEARSETSRLHEIARLPA
ncbi:hypothetical protein CO683_35010 [Bradyrhizobium ottawaense]|uniref:hypothetical protein n=1 Tax=Bradyrhizobium ottawaense TaxID=931866 RepID=UPI000BE89ECF|nr:hypothetical protein [Bradyrhizobium ottawaense]PDT64969.1 hypothetical protein CO683_35010 [Bradyrhizobium ottawaense]